MNRIDERTVELTDREEIISDQWNELLDQGYSQAEAVEKLKADWGTLTIDPAFWDYLSE